MIAPDDNNRNMKMQMFRERVEPRFVINTGVPIMSSWTRISNLPKQLQLQVLAIYEPPIPIEVRRTLTHWIDRRNWERLDLDHLEPKNMSQEIFDELCAIVEEKLLSSWGLADRGRLSEAFDTLKTRYTHNPTSLLRLLRRYILEERAILESFEKSKQNSGPSSSKSAAEFLRDCASLQKDSKVLEQQLKFLSKLYHETRNRAHESREIQGILEGYIEANQSEEVLDDVRKRLKFLTIGLEKRKEKLENAYENFLECFHSRLDMLAKLLRRFTDDVLGVWERSCQAMANGLPTDTNLEIVQRCFDRLEILPRTYSALVYLVGILLRGTPNLSEVLLSWKLPMLSQLFLLLMVKLMGRSFLIEEQPEQVVYSGQKVTCKVRYLFGRNATHIVLRRVRGYLVNESEFDASIHGGAGDETPAADRWIEPRSLNMTAEKGSVALFEFKLDSVNLAASARPCDTPPIAQKYRVMFETTFFAFDKEITVKTASSNFVVIQHRSNETFAKAIIFWDNLHLDAPRKSFEVRDRIPWPEIAEALSIKYHRETGMYLSEKQLQYLGSAALRKPRSESFQEEQLTWKQFSEDPVSGRTFTFWEWFHAGVNLARDHLKLFSMTGSFLGFIEKSDAEEIIFNEQSGSFLLRISDLLPGAVSIVSADGVFGRRVVVDQTISTHDLEKSPLTERLRNSKKLLYFYPDIPKGNIVPCMPSKKQNQIQLNPRKRRCVGSWQE